MNKNTDDTLRNDTLLDDNLLDDNAMAYSRLILKRFVNFRPAAYTSEVGEAVRPIVPKPVIWLGYGLSFGYVFADIGLKLHDIKDKPNDEIFWKGIDLSLWHASASIVVPAITIHTIVESVTKIQNNLIKRGKVLPPRFRAMFPSAIGLLSIFGIIHPIDKGTDYMLDNFIRPLYPVKITVPSKNYW